MAARKMSALGLAALASTAYAQAPGSFKIVGETKVSAMMMFLGNEENVYIIDKAEGNQAEINGHPAWGAVWNIKANQADVVNIVSNTFCASGFHLPNSSWIALGGNGPISPGPVDYHGPGVDPTYQDVDGRQAIRLVAPCGGEASTFADQCQWVDDPTRLHMQSQRWYSTAEALGSGEIFIIGGMRNGGFINRPTVNPRDPRTQDNLASNTFEFWPARAGFDTPPFSEFLIRAGGLNTYAHAFLMPSGKVLLQANISTILFNTDSYEEEILPDMPKNVIRVYPGSGGVAMLPLTPENNYNPTVLFCGGTNAFNNYQWGTYGGPNENTWEYRASADCQRLTPEPASGPVAYEQDDDMIQGRTMGQFVLLPDGSMLMMGGAANGTAGYTTQTPAIPRVQDLPFGLSLAAEEILTPAIYFPDKPNGQRWSNAGLGASTIPRMYHSTALVLPDASVFVAGSNPNGDVNASVTYNLPYPAEYRAEVWYPPYWGKPKPVPTGIPTTSLTYGGDYFNLTLANGSYTGAPNVAASKTKVVLLRSGFNTHAMSMGQRLLQLNNTYTVSDNGDITLHVSQLPANPNLFTPGPALMFVVVDGVPSQGKMLTVGTGNIERQPTVVAAALPPITTSTVKDAGGDNDGKNDDGKGGDKTESSSTPSIGLIVGAAAGGIAAAAALGALIWFICRKKNARKGPPAAAFDSDQAFVGGALATAGAQQQYGRVDTAATPDSAYPSYSTGAFNNRPGALTGAPFAMSSANSRGSYHSSLNELPAPQQPLNYDAHAAARVPSMHSESPYGGIAPSPQDQYYDPYRTDNAGSRTSR